MEEMMKLKDKLKAYQPITIQELYDNFTKVELAQLLINFQARQVTHKGFFHNYLALYMSNRNK
tara:strand:- start:503 stop:691 length:189 start_codon:yes stop_codon:yes gene_type:complete